MAASSAASRLISTRMAPSLRFVEVATSDLLRHHGERLRCQLNAPRRALPNRSPRQERHQLRNDLIRRLVHQPVAGAFDDYALNLVGHQAALLDEKLARGL